VNDSHPASNINTAFSLPAKMKIFLTGFAGSGKSFLGLHTSALLKIPFIDSDQIIEAEMGETIREIFKTKGENFFRTREAEVLRSFSRKRSAIISVGGGLPCHHDNMEWMNEHGVTVYLEASAAFLFHRLLKEKKMRPLLADLSDIELMIYITETLAARRAVYEQSQLKLNAENATPAKLFSLLKKKLK
jgi:shikimate kinase